MKLTFLQSFPTLRCMGLEILKLSKEQVDRAGRREGINHVVIEVLELNRSKLMEIDKALDGVKVTGEAREFIREHLGFLAEEFKGVAPFSLELLETIAIWSKLTEIVSHESLRDDIGFLLQLSYVVQGLDDPVWKDFPRYFLEKSELPPGAVNDKGGLSHVRRRAAEHEQTFYEQLYKYMWGSDKHIMALCWDAVNAVRVNADRRVVERATRRYEDARAHGDVYATPLLLKIVKEFCNPKMALFFDLSERALSAMDAGAV